MVQNGKLLKKQMSKAFNREDLIFHCQLTSEKDPMLLYWTKDPIYKDLVLVDATGKEIRIPTEHMLFLIQAFAKHLSIQTPTQDVSNISSRKSQVPKSRS
jgi:hypothetical protein